MAWHSTVENANQVFSPFLLGEGSVRVWGVGQFGITAAYEFYIIIVFLEYMNSPLHASVIYLFIFDEMG